MLLKIADLSPGERFLLERRRLREGQGEAAARHGVSRWRYRRWELGREDGPAVELGKLEPHEACFVIRTRSGVSVQDLAEAMGISRWWLIQMEYGDKPADRLVEVMKAPRRLSVLAKGARKAPRRAVAR